MRKKWIVPSSLEAKSAVEYIGLFLEANREITGFSRRNLAKKLSWPSSYITDIQKGRKPFTVQRALEFADHFSFDPLSREKLIFLAVASQFPQKGSEILEIIDRRNAKSQPRTEDFQMLDGPVSLIESIIRWRKQISADDIFDLVARHGITRVDVAGYLALLEQKGFIEGKRNLYSSVSELKETDDVDLLADTKFHSDCADFFKTNIKNRIKPMAYQSTFCTLDPQTIYEYHQRLVALRNWFTAESAWTFKHRSERSALFQLDLNLVPVVEHQIAYKKE